MTEVTVETLLTVVTVVTVAIGVTEVKTRAETAQTMAYSENCMFVKEVANSLVSWIMSRHLWENCE